MQTLRFVYHKPQHYIHQVEVYTCQTEVTLYTLQCGITPGKNAEVININLVFN